MRRMRIRRAQWILRHPRDFSERTQALAARVMIGRFGRVHGYMGMRFGKPTLYVFSDTHFEFHFPAESLRFNGCRRLSADRVSYEFEALPDVGPSLPA